MDKLLNPDTGLVFWTIITFLSLVFLLKKMAWGPLLSAIVEREERIKADLEGAQSARADAEKIKQDLEKQIASLEARSREMLAQVTREGESLRAQLKAAAEADAQKIRKKTLSELADEKRLLMRDLRQEVANLSVLAAEKLMRKSVDQGVQKGVLESFFNDLDKKQRPS